MGPPPFVASDDPCAGADRAGGTESPCNVSVSMYVREVVSGVCAVFEEAPAVGLVCKTLLSLENLVFTAKGNRKELAVLLELCDVVTRGALNQWTMASATGPGVSEGAAALRRHVEGAKRVAAMCNKGKIARFALGRKISRSIVSVKTNVVNFATVHNLSLSAGLHVKLANMEKELAAKERERQQAIDAAAKKASADAALNSQYRVVGLVKRLGSSASERALSVLDWCDYQRQSSSSMVKACGNRFRNGRPELYLMGGVLLATAAAAAACGQHGLLKRRPS
ncbi:unnamed protein product [Ectocarpus fasciculatus]